MTTLNTDLPYVYIPIAGAPNRYAILKTGMHFYDNEGYQFLISGIRLIQRRQLICMDAVGLPNSLAGIEESYTCMFVSGSLVFNGLYVNPADPAVGSCERHMIPAVGSCERHMIPATPTASISGTGEGKAELSELFTQGDVVLAKDGFSDEVLLLTHPIYMGDNFAHVITRKAQAGRQCIKGKTLTKIGSFTVPKGVR